VIGVVDGYFEVVPTVWHKEILWAMALGIRVYGAASIGAIRAAELADFGMIGVGKIYEDFRSGVLQDDDEVALPHGPEGVGFVPVTEAMVNVRAKFERAVKEGVIDTGVGRVILTVGKGLFYKNRSFAAILQMAGDAYVDAQRVSAFGSWAARQRVDQKRSDALAMLDRIWADSATRSANHAAASTFAHTAAWERQ
jgi:hypothetical protein